MKTILEGLGKPPQYYFHDATLNKSELSDYEKAFTEANHRLSVDDFTKLSEVAAVVDTRSSVEDLKKGYIKGAYLFFEGGSLAGWVGSILEPKTSVLLFTDSEEKAEELIRRVLRVGYHVAGYNGFTIDEWKAAGGEVSVPAYVKPEQINDNPERVVVDVRNQPEWVETGIVKGAITIPLAELEKHVTAGLLRSKRSPRTRRCWCTASWAAEREWAPASCRGTASRPRPSWPPSRRYWRPTRPPRSSDYRLSS